MIDPANIATMGTVLGAAIAYILRERSKNRNEKLNNGHLEIIKKQMATKEQLSKIDKITEIIKTNVENMQTNCKTTTERFGKEISNNRKEILDMAKERK